MDTEILQQIGLNKSEVKVYLTLLQLGSSTTGPLMHRAKVSSSKIYGILERLLEKGLVSFVIKAKTKYYQAVNPTALLDYLHEKEEQLKQHEQRLHTLISELTVKRESQEKQEARIFLGWKGVQNAYNHILEVLPKNSEFIGFVQPTEEEERREVKLFYLQYHKKRVVQGYITKLISNKALRNVFEKEPYSRFKKFDVRYIDNCPSGLVIFGNNILLVAFEKNPVAVIITSQQIADSYRKLFYATWKTAER